MVRHQHELVQLVETAVPAASQLLNNNFSNSLLTENIPPLPGVRGNEVDASLVNSANDVTHRSLQGLKPLARGSANVAVETATYKAPL